MRVLPYFQSNFIKQSAGTAGNSNNTQLPVNIRAAQSSAVSQDTFVPTSPVTGVVHSIKPQTTAAGRPSGVVKSGDYSFYSLDGRLDTRKTKPNGFKLDLKG